MAINMKTKKFLSLFLSVVIILSFFCSCAETDNKIAPFKNNEVEFGIGNANLEYFPGYSHYDPSNFYIKCDELLLLSSDSDNLEKAWNLYDELYKDAVQILDYRNAAQLGLDENPSSKFFSKEVEYTSSIAIEMQDKIKTIGHEISVGENAESFRDHLNNETLFARYVGYESLSDEIKELKNEESRLKIQYTNAANEVNVAFEKEGYTQKEANEKLGEVFLKLVSTRKKIAKAYGYDNYAEYADKEIFYRDYTKDDLAVLKETVKKYGKDIDYYSYYAFPDIEMPGVDADTIICDVGETVSKFSKKADESYTFLTNNGLITAGYETTRADSEYTTGFFNKESSAIFMKLYPDSQLYNYETFAHELGHFTQAMLMDNPIPLFMEDGCIDVMELHSTFLETLFFEKCDDIFIEPEYMKAFELAQLSYSIESGCYYDDWQRAIYESDKDLSLDEINSLYKKILLEYGVEEYEEMEYEWMWVQHNFMLPMYYISYAVSAFAAMEIWDIAQYDFEWAVSIWEKALTVDAYNGRYMGVIENIGLLPFRDAEKTEEVMGKAVDYMEYVDELTYGTDYEYLEDEFVSDTDLDDFSSSTNLE